MKSRLAIAVCGLSICLAAEPVYFRCWIAVKGARERHHTAETLRKWQEWGKAHPGWKQPKTTKETLQAIDFACGPLDTIGEEVDLVLPEEPGPEIEIPAELDFTTMPPVGTDLTYTLPVVADDSTGYPIIYPGSLPIPAPPAGGTPTLTGLPPGNPAPSPVPEPASFWMLGTGLLCLVVRRKDG